MGGGGGGSVRMCVATRFCRFGPILKTIYQRKRGGRKSVHFLKDVFTGIPKIANQSQRS